MEKIDQDNVTFQIKKLIGDCGLIFNIQLDFDEKTIQAPEKLLILGRAEIKGKGTLSKTP